VIPVQRDALGFPRIRARDREDGAFAHGWMIARDRLLQVTLARMAARGRVMEIAGDTPIARVLDRSVRMLDLLRGCDTEITRVGERARGVVRAFCDGFNACLATRRMPRLLRALGVPVQPMTPAEMLLLYRF
jgi:penicillin amidase